MAKTIEKTNAMRILDGKKIPYILHDYTASGAVSGADAARAMGLDPDRVFKTLVTESASKKNYVFMIPVEKELDLKKAASFVGEKWVDMIPSKNLLPLTGYIHGGCSPIGMKKLFRTIADVSAENYDVICFSAGKIGYQFEVGREDLCRVVPVEFTDLVTD